MIDKQLLLDSCRDFEINLPESAPDKLDTYAQLLVEWNEKMNLTAITEPREIVLKHFVDSLLLLKEADFREKRVVDIGCGGGFPGVPLKIGCPQMDLTLLDSLGKRMRWLEETLPILGVSAECVTARAEEEAARRREGYDFAVSRAVARLNVLAELCLPYVKVGGFFLSMKGPDCEEEISAAARGIQILGGTLRPSYDYTIPGTDVHHRIVVVEKTAPTPSAYPRRWAKMQKAPL